MPRPSPPPPPHPLGERLRALRAKLEFFGWSRARLAQATGLSVATLTRLERQGRGPAPALVKLLDFYRAQGLSVNWVVAADNSRLFPYSFDERWPDELRREVVEELADVRHLAQEPLVRERLTRALRRLLPPQAHPLRGPLDLSHYHRWLPPVAAATAGWYSAGYNELPRHYYPAGDSLPLCADAFAYLTHDGAPQPGSRAVRCPRCAERLPEA